MRVLPAAVPIGFFLFLGIAIPVSAELIERDWLTPGDGLLTYDPINGREWLDVQVSELSQFGTLVDDAVAVAQLELLPGGRFKGFFFATREDVEQLVAAAGFDQSTFERRAETADQLRDLIRFLAGPEALLEPQGTGYFANVINETTDSISPIYPNQVAVFMGLSRRITTRPDGLGGVSFNNRGDFFTQASVNEGMMLYRLTIPEPSASLLLPFTALAFAISSRGPTG